MFLAQKRGAFTIVELMIVVAIIGILIAIAVPGFLKARERSRLNSCQETQHKIDGAVQQYILDEDIADQPTAVATLGGIAGLVGSDNYIRFTPECPSNGTYTLKETGVAVDCDANDGVAEYDHSIDVAAGGS